MNPRVIVAADGLYVRYGGRPALTDAGLRVAVGEWVSILGPNGSGKTTLLRAIGAYLRPAAGTVAVDGRPAEAYGRQELARVLATVGVNLPSDFPLAVSEFVMLGRIPHAPPWSWAGPRDRSVVAEALDRTGMSDLADRPMDRLSAGERQRAMLARALAQEPSVLLLDEPTVHLDIRRQIEMLDLLARLKATAGLTVIAVLHDINLAALYSDRLVLMRAGSPVAAGTPAEVLTPDTLEAVFECRVAVQEHPGRPVPQVVVLPGGTAGAAAPAAETVR